MTLHGIPPRFTADSRVDTGEGPGTRLRSTDGRLWRAAVLGPGGAVCAARGDGGEVHVWDLDALFEAGRRG